MTVRDLQTFLKNLAALLASQQGAKPGGEFDSFAQGLEPFADWQIGTLGQFLRDADEYRRTGRVPEPAAKAKTTRARATRAAPKLATASNVEAVEAAVARLRAMHDRYDDPTLTQSEIEAVAEQLSGQFDANGLKAVARGFGISSGLTSKAATKGKIVAHVMERRERHERSRQFSALPPAPGEDGVPGTPDPG